MSKNTRFFGLLLVVLALSVVMVPFASANSDLVIDYIRIDGEQFDDITTSNLALEVTKGMDIPIRVRLHAQNNDVNDVQVSAGIYGYDYSNYETDKIYDISRSFDLDVDSTRNVDLDLEVPVRGIDDNTPLLLRIVVADQNTPNAYIIEYQLDVEGADRENAMMIKEAYLNPSNQVMAGRAVSALVKVENIGSEDLDDITLVVSVPALGIRDTETLDELNVDDVETFEKIILRFPANTQPGQYVVEYTVKFDEYESVTKTDIVTVTPCENTVCGATSGSSNNGNQAQESRTVVQVPNSQVVYAGGSEAVYPLMINNLGDESKAYTIAVSGVDAWGTARVDPGAAVVIPGQNSATVFIYVGANADVEPSEKYFKVSVGTADGDMKEIPLSAQVSAQNGAASASNSGLQRTLEIALIILIIILLLIGLIVGFNKLRGNNDDDEAKTYY